MQLLLINTPYDFVGHPNIQAGKHASDENIESNHQKSDIVEKHTSGDGHH